MRTLDEHRVNEANEQLIVEVLDAPGAGGANHCYRIRGFDSRSNPSDPYVQLFGVPAIDSRILFQNGPIGEAGVNGLTNEVLLAIVADRLRSFQTGPYACNENQDALNHVEWALGNLKARTQARLARGVEGTHAL